MNSIKAIDGRGPFAGGTSLPSATLGEQHPVMFQATAVRTHGVPPPSASGLPQERRFPLVEGPSQMSIRQDLPLFTYLSKDKTAQNSAGPLQPAFADLGGMSESQPWGYLGISRSAVIANQLNRTSTISVSHPAGAPLHNNGGSLIRAGQYIGYAPPETKPDRIQSSKYASNARPLMVPLTEFADEWKEVTVAVRKAYAKATEDIGNDENKRADLIREQLNNFGLDPIPEEMPRVATAQLKSRVESDVHKIKQHLHNGAFAVPPLLRRFNDPQRIQRKAQAGYIAYLYYFQQPPLHAVRGVDGQLMLEDIKSQFLAWIFDEAEKERRNMCGGRALTTSKGMSRSLRDGQYDKDIYVQGKIHY